jgi:flagellin-like hook-associated protein FlgL
MTRQEIEEKLERVKLNKALPEKQRQQLIDVFNKKLELLDESETKSSRDSYNKELENQLAKGQIKDKSQGISLLHLAENMKNETKTTPPASEAAETKPKGKKGRPAGSTTKSKEGKPVKSAAPKKRRMKKEKVAPVKKADAKKEAPIITVAGKEYNLEDCRQAIEAFKARKEQATKTQKKYKSKSPSLKAKENMEDVISNITDTIGKKAIENEPKQVVGALRTFKKKMDEAFSALGKVLSETEVKRLKSALNEIEEVIKGIEAKTK